MRIVSATIILQHNRFWIYIVSSRKTITSLRDVLKLKYTHSWQFST